MGRTNGIYREYVATMASSESGKGLDSREADCDTGRRSKAGRGLERELGRQRIMEPNTRILKGSRVNGVQF